MKIQTLLKSHTNNTEDKIINRLASESDFNSNIKAEKFICHFLKYQVYAVYFLQMHHRQLLTLIVIYLNLSFGKVICKTFL